MADLERAVSESVSQPVSVQELIDALLVLADQELLQLGRIDGDSYATKRAADRPTFFQQSFRCKADDQVHAEEPKAWPRCSSNPNDTASLSAIDQEKAGGLLRTRSSSSGERPRRSVDAQRVGGFPTRTTRPGSMLRRAARQSGITGRRS